MKTLLDCLQDKLVSHMFGVSLLCDLALQIADGMAYLEKRRLIHRDPVSYTHLTLPTNREV